MNVKTESVEDKTKYHHPDERLRKYIEQKSLLLHEIRALEKRGKKAKTNGEKDQLQQEREEIKTRTRSLANVKIQVLDDVVFPSMANVAYFFDAVSKDPELESTFSSDITELLGVRRERPRPNNYAFVFVHLIQGMISTPSEYQETDYRIRLVHELQKIIWFKFQDLGQRTFPVGQFSAIKTVIEDIYRVLSWTEMIAWNIPDQYNFEEVQAPEEVPEKYLKDEETKRKYKNKRVRERWEKFDSKQQKPKRTITF